MILSFTKLPFKLPIASTVGREGIITVNTGYELTETYLPVGSELPISQELHKYRTTERYGSLYRERFYISTAPWKHGSLHPILVKLYGADWTRPLVLRKGCTGLRNTLGVVTDTSTTVPLFTLLSLMDLATPDDTMLADYIYEMYYLTLKADKDLIHNDSLTTLENACTTDKVLRQLEDCWYSEQRAGLNEGTLSGIIMDRFCPDFGEAEPDPLTYLYADRDHLNSPLVDRYMSEETELSHPYGVRLDHCTTVDYNPCRDPHLHQIYDLVQNAPYTEARFTYILLEGQKHFDPAHSYALNRHHGRVADDHGRSLAEQIWQRLSAQIEPGHLHVECVLLDNELVVYFYSSNRVDALYYDLVVLAACSHILAHT